MAAEAAGSGQHFCWRWRGGSCFLSCVSVVPILLTAVVQLDPDLLNIPAFVSSISVSWKTILMGFYHFGKARLVQLLIENILLCSWK